MSSSLSPILSMLNATTGGSSTTLSPLQSAQQQLQYQAIQDPNSLNSFAQKKETMAPGAGGFRRLKGRTPPR